jgi:predicted dienelactone hydrolase
MRLTTSRALRAAALALGAALVRRSRLLATLIAATFAPGLVGLLPGDAAAAASAGLAADLRVGHTVKRIVVSGSALGENRAVDVHLWYPADQRGLSDAPKTVYKSALHRDAPGVADRWTAVADLWDPLAWTVEAEIARETDAIDQHGKPFPVIVFSHGATNDPIDYAHTLELIASAGFVVAAPGHTNNTQDDLLIDFINGRAAAQVPPRGPLFMCKDGRPAPCARGSVPFSMADRARDVSKVLDELPTWFGGRVDVARAGVIGHSRGTVTALAAAGGSAPWSSPPTVNCRPVPAELCWPLQREPRVRAIMGMAIGAPAITSGVNLANVTVPALLVRGMKDTNSRPEVSKDAFDTISSADKILVDIPNATHRSFDSTYCAQMQSAGAAFDTDGDGVVRAEPPPGGGPPEVDNPRPILDRQTIGLIAASAPGGLSGKAVHYCASDFFTSPVNITELVKSTPNAEFPPAVGGTSVCLTTSIPCTGLETEEVKQGVTELAVAFFGTVLKRVGNDGTHFTRYLAPKWLEKHEPMVGNAEAYASADAICPPGQDVVCED